MLYDPKWGKEPSVAGFKAWLALQPAGRGYDWLVSKRCACGQYAASIGVKGWELRILTIIAGGVCMTSFWGRMNALAGVRPYTFAALLERVEAWEREEREWE